jgi:hypothetical protein
MSRHRLILLTLATLLASTTLTLTASAQVDYGNVELGEIDTICVGLCYGNDCQASGDFQSVDIAPPFHVRNLRLGSFDDVCGGPGTGTPATLPVTVGSGQVLSVDIDLVATDPGPVSEDLFIDGDTTFPFLANVLPAAPCPPSQPDVLCLQNERFTVRTTWRTPFLSQGPAQVVQNVTSDDSGLFYFFNSNNWEMLLKVLDGCGTNDHFWVFAAATTNVEFTITVTDTQEQKVSTYFNPLGTPAAPIQDTSAFATCP